MGNIGLQEAMQGDIAKALDTAIEAPIKIVRILVEIRRSRAEADRNNVITRMQKEKLKVITQTKKSGSVKLKDLDRSGGNIAELSDVDIRCLKVLKKNLNETGIRYHVDRFTNKEGNSVFSVLFEERSANKVQHAIKKSIAQMEDPKFMKKTKDRDSVIEKLTNARKRAEELNKDLPEKNKIQEQSR